jgi:hypothetical protein
MRQVRWVTAFACVTLAGAGPVAAQQVEAVDMALSVGRGESDLIDTRALGRMLEMHVGDRYTPEAMRDDHLRLLALGMFQGGAPGSGTFVAPGVAGVRVTHYLVPNPKVLRIEFPGASTVQAGRLVEAISPLVSLGSVFSTAAAAGAVRRVAEEYRSADVAATVGVPIIDSQGTVTLPVLEHRVDRVTVTFRGAAALRSDALLAVLPLHRFDLVRPTAIEAAEKQLESCGLLEESEVTPGGPDPTGLVPVTVSVRCRSIPAPATRGDIDLLDPKGLPSLLKAPKPLRIDVPFDLTPAVPASERRRLAASDTASGLLAAALAAMDAGDRDEALTCARTAGSRPAPAEADQWWAWARCRTIVGDPLPPAAPPQAHGAVAAARTALAVAEAELERLCVEAKCLPQPPLTFQRLAGALAAVDVPDPCPWGTSEYAKATQRASDLLIALKGPTEVRACFPEIEELVAARHLLRRFDSRIPTGPPQLPGFAEAAFGNPTLFDAARKWQEASPTSPSPLIVMGTLALGRAMIDIRAPAGKGGARSWEFGGPAASAALAALWLTEGAALARTESAGVAGRIALAYLLSDVKGTDPARFVEALSAPGVAEAEALVYAAVGEDGLLGGETGEIRGKATRDLAAALTTRGEVRNTRLAVYALLWGGDAEGAAKLLEQRLPAAGDEGAETLALRGMVALRRGDARAAADALARAKAANEREKVLEEAPLSRILACARLVAGDRAGAEAAFGVGR